MAILGCLYIFDIYTADALCTLHRVAEITICFTHGAGCMVVYA